MRLEGMYRQVDQPQRFPRQRPGREVLHARIETLVEVTGLKKQRDADAKANAALGVNWLIVGVWDEKSRYRQWSEPQARKLVIAVSDAANGVLPWIMGHW
jgi:hypothetical protein